MPSFVRIGALFNLIMKQCSCCKKYKSLQSFYKRTASKDGYQSYCKQCSKEYYKERHTDNVRPLKGDNELSFHFKERKIIKRTVTVYYDDGTSDINEIPSIPR